MIVSIPIQCCHQASNGVDKRPPVSHLLVGSFNYFNDLLCSMLCQSIGSRNMRYFVDSSALN